MNQVNGDHQLPDQVFLDFLVKRSRLSSGTLPSEASCPSVKIQEKQQRLAIEMKVGRQTIC